MARTKSKSKGVQIRRVMTKEDRKRPSVFMRLKQDEMFKGYALFEPDPEAKDNPGYYEYYDHYDKQGNTYVPCAGDKCPFCAANDNPATRALTVWFFPDNDAKDQIKVFTMNYSTTTDISDEAEEEDGLVGKKVRIKRMDDRGDYKVRILTDKPLTKAELKKAMKLLEEKFPNGLEAVVMKQLQAQMERLKALDALEDDDDDEDDDEPTTSRKGKKAEADDDDDEEEDDDDDDDATVASIEDEEYEILKVSKKNGTITVEHDGENVEMSLEDADEDASDFSKGDTVTISADYDEDDETWGITSISTASDDDEDEDGEAEPDDDDDDDDDDEEEAEAETEISAEEFTVVKFQEKDEILDVTNSDGEKVKMWVGEGVEVDADEVKKGVTVTLDAQQDDEGDWIITDLTVKKAKGGKKGGKSKSKK